jgi:phosphoribosylaminoimidazole-succinocarboxamide synthase
MPAPSETLAGLDFPWPYARWRGKVRESFSLPDGRRLLVTTDRLSAFDRVLATIPHKGQVLNQLSAFWFERTADLIPNHLVAVPHPNVSLVRECEPLLVEVIVRGHITGVTKTSLWTLYAAGEREIYGYRLPEGLWKDDKLPEPLITPTTKAGPGEHDERLTCAQVVERGLVDPATWDRAQDAALAVFRRGQAIAEAARFVLVDTKYEFGRDADGTLMLIDEVHTPDSSRFWRTEDLARGAERENWDKEYVRLWYAGQGYRGDGDPPALPPEIVTETSRRYVGLYERLTGRPFEPAPQPSDSHTRPVLESYLGEGRA